nr:MAG TPA: hypothetical protein [Caudoviricetes sp.]
MLEIPAYPFLCMVEYAGNSSISIPMHVGTCGKYRQVCVA